MIILTRQKEDHKRSSFPRITLLGYFSLNLAKGRVPHDGSRQKVARVPHA